MEQFIPRVKALGAATGLEPTPSNIEKVSRLVDPEAASWAFSQWALRKQAQSKFDRARTMFFVREALEQASHPAIAAYHASLFPRAEVVGDLCCGIGADLIALARRGPAIGYEIDSERAFYAGHNLEVYKTSAEIRTEDSLAAKWDFRYAFADPARRVQGRRTLDPAEFAPNPVELSRRMSELSLGVLKLSPMLSDDFLSSLGPLLEFLSFGGECREALVSMGTEATEGRFAVHIESGERLAAGHSPSETAEPGGFLFDADPAAVRSHALGTLCQQFDLRILGTSPGYLTGASLVESVWLKSFRVLATGRFDIKDLKRKLVELDSATPVLKQRGAGQDLDRILKSLRLDGKRKLSVAIWPVDKSLRYGILE